MIILRVPGCHSLASYANHVDSLFFGKLKVLVNDKIIRKLIEKHRQRKKRNKKLDWLVHI
jgi:hypothetical protein